MILVNTTFIIDKRLYGLFTRRLRDSWCRAVEEGGMSRMLMLRILHDEEPETARIAVQFQTENTRAYDEWLEARGADALNALTADFPSGSVVHFTTLMGILATGGAEDDE